MALWKEPDPKKWWSFIVDGRHIATMQECAAVDREILRVRGLIGVSVTPATDETLIKAKAKTVLPKRITSKMLDAAKGYF